MEVGANVWVRDKEGEEAWVAGTVLEKSAGKPCKVEIEVDEDFSEDPLSFTFHEDEGGLIFLVFVFWGALRTKSTCAGGQRRCVRFRTSHPSGHPHLLDVLIGLSHYLCTLQQHPRHCLMTVENAELLFDDRCLLGTSKCLESSYMTRR